MPFHRISVKDVPEILLNFTAIILHTAFTLVFLNRISITYTGNLDLETVAVLTLKMTWLEAG